MRTEEVSVGHLESCCPSQTAMKLHDNAVVSVIKAILKGKVKDIPRS